MSGDSNLSNGLVEQAKSISNNLNELATKLESTKLEVLATEASDLGDKNLVTNPQEFGTKLEN